MRVEFEEKGHVYSVNGNIASSSVTELLKKHGLAPKYENANPKDLKKRASVGKEVHKDLENILNESQYEPKTKQGEYFLEWVKDNLDCGVGEQVLGYEGDEGLTLAGAADVMGFMKDGSSVIADHKNTVQFHREYVSWQVSILDYFARRISGDKINGKPFNWSGAKKFLCFHYNPKTGEMSVKELEKISDTEIERLLQCEINDEIYQRPNLVVDADLQQRFLTAEQYLIQVQEEYNRAVEASKKIREEMLKIFQDQGIQSWSSPNGIKVNFVQGYDKMSVDSAKLKKDFPSVYTQCQKITKIKPSIRISFKEEDEEI